MTPFDLIRELYPRFLDCGYTPLLFWQLSTAEIVDMLESWQRQQDHKRSMEKGRLRDMATILDGFGNVLLHNLVPGGKALRMKDVFPDLYHTDQQAEDQPAATAADMEVYKAERLYHAYCFNAARNKAGGRKE